MNIPTTIPNLPNLPGNSPANTKDWWFAFAVNHEPSPVEYKPFLSVPLRQVSKCKAVKIAQVGLEKKCCDGRDSPNLFLNNQPTMAIDLVVGGVDRCTNGGYVATYLP